MSTRRHIAVVVLLVTLVTAAPAFAQQDAATRRPYRGLFGSPSPSGSPHSLLFSASVFVAYDDNVVDRRPTQTSVSWLQQSGAYQGATAALNYSFFKAGDRLNFQGQLGARLHYLHRGSQSITRLRPSNGVAVSVSARLTRSLTLGARQSAAYHSNYNPSPTYQYGFDFDHDLGVDDDPSLDLFELGALRTASTLSLTQSLGRYASMSGAYHFRWVKVFADDSSNSRFRDYGSHAGSVNLQYARPVSANATFVLGYGLRVSDGGRTSEPPALHHVNAGVNYSRALSFSRRTSLSFSTGSAMAVSERADTLDSLGDNTRTHLRLIGNVALAHEIGRTWTAQLAYTRGYRSRDGFDELFFTDAVGLSVGGLVSRRLSFSSAATWADSSFDQQSGRHRGQTATARALYALTPFAALYAQYYYYHHRFNADVQLDPRLPRQLDRHGVRAGITTSVPLIR